MTSPRFAKKGHRPNQHHDSDADTRRLHHVALPKCPVRRYAAEQGTWSFTVHRI
jgi:hypothetical protein